MAAPRPGHSHGLASLALQLTSALALVWIALHTAARGEAAPPGVLTPQEAQEAHPVAPAQELLAAAAELRSAARALAEQAAAPAQRTRVEPGPASGPQQRPLDPATIRDPRASPYGDLTLLAGRIPPRQEPALSALRARLTEDEKSAKASLWFSSPAEVVRFYGMPDETNVRNGQIHLLYERVGASRELSLEFRFFEGVLVSVD